MYDLNFYIGAASYLTESVRKLAGQMFEVSLHKISSPKKKMSKTTANLGQNKIVLVHEDLLGVSLARSAPLVEIFFLT